MSDLLDDIPCASLGVLKDEEYNRMVSLFGDEYERTLRKVAKVAVDLRFAGKMKEAAFIEELFIRFWKLRKLLESNERRNPDQTE